jgi:hypothetical protein
VRVNPSVKRSARRTAWKGQGVYGLVENTFTNATGNAATGAAAGADRDRPPVVLRPVPELPDIMVTQMYTLGLVDPETREQYPEIPDTAIVVVIRGVGLRRVDKDLDT